MTPGGGDITVILQRWDTDRQSVVEALTPIVYRELHVIATAYLRRQRPDHTLQPTALVNEAYLRLVRQDSTNLRDRSHFYALAARMMRQILVDTARQRLAQKRGSGSYVPLDAKLATRARAMARTSLPSTKPSTNCRRTIRGSPKSSNFATLAD
jgi:RNA polymerase sigma factor (TIGR02999 family)